MCGASSAAARQFVGAERATAELVAGVAQVDAHLRRVWGEGGVLPRVRSRQLQIAADVKLEALHGRTKDAQRGLRSALERSERARAGII